MSFEQWLALAESGGVAGYDPSDYMPGKIEALRAAWDAATAVTRERCAQVAEGLAAAEADTGDLPRLSGFRCAAEAIRATAASE